MGLVNNLIQQAIKLTSATTAEDGRQQTGRQFPASVRVCFSIKVYASTIGPDGSLEPREVQELEAGKSYEVVILCEQSHNRPDVADHLVTGNFTLNVLGTYKPPISQQPLYHRFDVAYGNVCKPKYELPAWHVTIPENLPTCDLTVSLTLKEPAFHPRSNISPQTFPVPRDAQREWSKRTKKKPDL